MRIDTKASSHFVVLFCLLHTYILVSIWLACLDQHGQIMAGRDRASSSTPSGTHDAASSVQVAAHDPNNIIVQYWSVSLVGSGLKNLLFQLSDLPQQPGTWTIRATAGGVTAAQTFSVLEVGHDHHRQRRADHPSQQGNKMEEDSAESATNGAAESSDREDKVSYPSSMVESHFVELDFSPRTATSIQQGSPFAGEVRSSTYTLILTYVHR